MHKQNLTALERELIDRLLSLEKADALIETITEKALGSCESALKEASAREDDLTDEMIQWRRLALAWRRRVLNIHSEQDALLTHEAISLSNHIKLCEGWE